MPYINTPEEFTQALSGGPYAWPGGYPLFFITADGAALSFKAAADNADQIKGAIGDNDRHSGWRVVAVDINWEDPDLTCDHTGDRIQSAYGSDE